MRYDEFRNKIKEYVFFRSNIFEHITDSPNLLRRQMVDWVKRSYIVKLKKGFFHKIKFEAYTIVRKIPSLQDLMAKVGTEYLLKKMKVDYKRMIAATYLTTGAHIPESDNFIVFAYR